MQPQVNASKRKEELDGIASVIVRCAYKVANTLGTGFLEKVYENALVFELREAGLHVEQQTPIKVQYRGILVGEYSQTFW